eukprot:GEMP01089478.1.p2 GENE.GEMP01089478.1~~GEMP01089478.1.p2  ORF type:complete len:138 (-),score=21.81 GEMP01089478.1:77-490(-)
MGSPLQTLLELHSTQKFLGYKQYGLGSLQPMCRALMVMHSTHMFPRVQNPSPLLDRQANDKLHIAPPGHLTPNSTVLQSSSRAEFLVESWADAGLLSAAVSLSSVFPTPLPEGDGVARVARDHARPSADSHASDRTC